MDGGYRLENFTCLLRENENEHYKYTHMPSGTSKFLAAAGCVPIMWSTSLPVTDWPPSSNHMSGTIAPKYGPQTPFTNDSESLSNI